MVYVRSRQKQLHRFWLVGCVGGVLALVERLYAEFPLSYP